MAMPQRPSRLLTAEEFQMIAETHYPDDKKMELHDGVMVAGEPQAFESSDVGATVLGLLWTYVREHRLGRVLGEGGTYVVRRGPDSVYVPDVSFVPTKRVPYASARRKYVEGGPALAVEVMSPSDRFSALRRKANVFLATGTQLVWIVRPADRTVVVLRAGSEHAAILTEADELDGENVIPGFRCPVAEVFRED